MKSRLICFLSGLVILSGVFWLAGYIHFHMSIMAYPAQQDRHNIRAQSADAIIVLTGGSDRIKTGLTLLERDIAPRMFISGVGGNVTLDNLLTLRGHDINNTPCCIVLGHKAQNTNGNAREAYEWIEQNDIDHIYLVTADYHMPRTRLEFSYILPEMEISYYPVISDTKTSHLMLAEYNKTLLAWVRLYLFPNLFPMQTISSQ